ncbi:ElyC/SanA/YdcF family protein [Arcobacter arenosus]|uniref:ElyC/SanA/YdcF family protein n=1 Tax=Arcobacter arenosus TaxID=2576037 RepID=UPI003BAA9D70
MLFSLKKFISFFLMPLSISMILFLVGLYFLFSKSYKKAKLFLSVSFLWLFLISYSPFSNALIKPLENEYKAYLDVDSSIEYVLVLGSGHNTNKEISPHSQLSSSALMRLTEGIRIFKKLDNGKLIVSGYGGDDETPHAIISKEVAVSMGIDEKNILTQEEVKDTFEEAQYVKKIVGDKTFILVTSAYHMPRAMKLFKQNGLNAIAAPTDFLQENPSVYTREPNAIELRKTQVAMHEYIGILWASILEKYRFYVN